MNLWDSWPKPWNREQCREYFVRSTAFTTLQALADLSGVARPNLSRWRKADLDGPNDWDVAQAEFRTELRAATHDKTIDNVSTDLATLETSHVEAYQLLRECAIAKVRSLKSKIDQAGKGAAMLPGIAVDSMPDEMVKADADAKVQAQAQVVKDTDVQDLRQLSTVIDLAIKGERMILGGEYEDLNKAVQALTKAGLEVRIPSSKVLVNGLRDE
ncbi:MAG: hypothetical protein RLZZ511_4146 [Cyanobacteriota bacterium]|jgi:hypothetical protein